MDRRSWIFNSEPFSPAFLASVEEFMEHVRTRFSEDEKIKCPCQKCLNQREKTQDEVQEDIEINGMSRCYTCWIHHGEEANAVELDADGDLAVVPENMPWDANEQTTIEEEVQAGDVKDDSARGVQGLIQDLHTAASHGFGGNLYKEIMEEAKRELYQDALRSLG